MAECAHISCCRFSMLSFADWPRIVVMYTVYILTDLGACVCVCAPAYIYSLVIRACVRAGKFLALLVYQDTARMRVRASCACIRVRMWIVFVFIFAIAKMNVCCYHVPDAKNEIRIDIDSLVNNRPMVPPLLILTIHPGVVNPGVVLFLAMSYFNLIYVCLLSTFCYLCGW